MSNVTIFSTKKPYFLIQSTLRLIIVLLIGVSFKRKVPRGGNVVLWVYNGLGVIWEGMQPFATRFPYM